MKKKWYETPVCTVIHVATEHYLLGESGPKARPGGDQGGSVTIENPTEDDDDTNLSGAKRWAVDGKKRTKPLSHQSR